MLQMAAAELGDIASFPFVEAPDRTQVTDGLRLLTELGAVQPAATGRRPARPRRRRGPAHQDRPAARRAPGRPADGPHAAGRRARGLPGRDARHRRRACRSPTRASVRPSSASAPRRCTAASGRRCRATATVRPRSTRRKPADGEADRARGATSSRCCGCGTTSRRRARSCRATRSGAGCARSSCTTCGSASGRTCTPSSSRPAATWAWARTSMPAGPDQIHTAALAGSAVARRAARRARGTAPGPRRQARRPKRRRPTREYLGARGTRFVIGSGSAAGEQAAAPGGRGRDRRDEPPVRPDGRRRHAPRQVEQVAQHLLNRQYSEPHWSSRSGAVLAYEQVTLYGVPIVSRRRVGYAKIDPVEARAIFLRAALVEGLWHTRHRFVARNAGRPRRGRGARGTHPAPRPDRGRRHDLRVLRRPGAGRRHVRARPSTPGGRTPASRRRTCST